ncbi:MAG TPA: potassium transporter Kup [Thermodesulfobacteriota bacterium]
MPPLVLFVLGVVFGDIGTSPLYAFRECFSAGHAIMISPENVFGILSLMFWSLIIIISVKYVLFVMRADYHGEGGIFALLTLVLSKGRIRGRRLRIVTAIGLFGAALFYGDGMLTPAISVLSAIEGLKVTTSSLDPFVVPITVGILIGLFLFQRSGTGLVGRVFGPVMVIWFLTIAILGARWIIEVPEVLKSINPVYALNFFVINRVAGFFVLGAVFLVVTGGEALYADMGHFGKIPIRIAWFTIVLPGLLLNYFGQGALLIENPHSVINPFYLLSPSWGHYPLIALSTAATIIASQAVISGAFSLTSQALQLGYIPRLVVSHTSHHEIGQVYVPVVNWILFIGTVGIVVGFGSSANLAGAYGLAVALLMVVTTALMFICARSLWGWSLLFAGFAATLLLFIEIFFLGSNLAKFKQGAWFPLLVTTIVYVVFITWKQGRTILRDRIKVERLPMKNLIDDLEKNPPLRVKGVAVFMSSNPSGVPRTLLHNLKHNRVLHEHVIILTVLNDEIPRVPAHERLEVQEIAQNFFRIIAHYGFMETPDVPDILHLARKHGLEYSIHETTFFLGRETLVLGRSRKLSNLQKRLFMFLSRNAQDATLHYGIPTNRAIEIGIQVEI